MIRKFLFSKGIRYRLHTKLPGKPDLVFYKRKIAVFINGCFWHKHQGCKNFVLPKTNTDFWENKIDGNVKRDCINYEKLIELGWKPLVIWECEIKKSVIDSTDVLLRQLNYD